MEAHRKSLSLRVAAESLVNELGRPFVDALLTDATNSTHISKKSTSTTVRVWRGLPHSSNVDVLVDQLDCWSKFGSFPFTLFNSPALPFSSEPCACSPSESPPEAVIRAAQECTVDAYRAALLELAPSGVARLLGMRATAGSVAGALPIHRAALATAAAKEHAAGSGKGPRLTVAARALAKHCGRMPPGWLTSYWGEEDVVMRGGVVTRNSCASLVVHSILDDAVWMNVHHAPGGVHVLELRVQCGHGARWHVADKAFRGFLEPHSNELAAKKKANCKALEQAP